VLLLCFCNYTAVCSTGPGIPQIKRFQRTTDSLDVSVPTVRQSLLSGLSWFPQHLPTDFWNMLSLETSPSSPGYVCHNLPISAPALDSLLCFVCKLKITLVVFVLTSQLLGLFHTAHILCGSVVVYIYCHN
jgi:hypothetical protein